MTSEHQLECDDNMPVDPSKENVSGRVPPEVNKL